MRTWRLTQQEKTWTGQDKLTRPVDGARLPPEWAEPLTQGRMAALTR